MSMEILMKIRETGKEIKRMRLSEAVDYDYMTAPCGLPCFECYLYLAQFDEKMAETIASVLSLPKAKIKCKGLQDRRWSMCPSCNGVQSLPMY